jgi:hypothetical protein
MRPILAIFLSVLVLLTGGSGLASGMVVCTDADGCVVVERPHAGHDGCHRGDHDADAVGESDEGGGVADAEDGACADTTGVTTGLRREAATPDFSRLEPVAFGLITPVGPGDEPGALRGGRALSFDDGAAWALRLGELTRLRAVVLVI